MKLLPLLLLPLALPTSAAAYEAGELYGLGGRTCAEFAQAYSKNPEMIESLYFTWAQGFMSGLNLTFVANLHKFADLGSTSMAEQKGQLRDYCNQHPLSPYYSAVLSL